jgi:hypothetical protein
LRSTERTGIKTISASDAQILVVEHNAVIGGVKTVHRTDGGTRGIRAMHAGYGYGFFTPFTVSDGDDVSPVHPPWNFMFVVAGRNTGITLDAAFDIT